MNGLSSPCPPASSSLSASFKVHSRCGERGRSRRNLLGRSIARRSLCPRPTLRHVLPSGGDYSAPFALDLRSDTCSPLAATTVASGSLCAAHTVFKDIKKRCLAAAAFTLLVSRAFFRAVVTPDRSFHQAHAVRHVSKRTFWRHYKARFFTHVALLAFHWNGMKSKYSSSVTLTLMRSN